ncbi:mediator of RNA polymerase II transcription subunit 27 [Rhododendron vialii]|uniref:mediator of RNA polymerase II transcription subunit 27 n=1 Tax=Rhododendron vialii TaxID=182163 RepID=UPI00265E13AA|nr:mediator of RNA polymerase II transcription subunit 27 [Rhododendron vialii]
MQQQAPSPLHSPAESRESATEAPPKQVALAMDRLSNAGRLIADIRLGADRLLEALFVASQPHQFTKPLHLILKEEASMRQHLHDLRTIGRQLEDSGVLNESLRSRSNSWGLHMPLVCPDGAVVAYAWKRQLAGQAGASAVDRTRLALKAFTDQKRRFFPHLDDGAESISKKICSSQASTASHEEELNEYGSLSDFLLHLEKEVPNVKINTYERLDWLKRASSLASAANESVIETPKEHAFHSSNNLRQGTVGSISADKVAVIELLFPSVFRAIVSLHPVGSMDPDAVAFFSPDEGGSYVHARGFSVHHVFKHTTEHAAMALQYFLGLRTETALHSLVHWICSYQTLFTKVCSKCRRLLSMDIQSALMLPPVHRPYRKFSISKTTTQTSSSTKDQSVDISQAYHIDCFPEEA